MEVIVGTYNHVLFGFELSKQETQSTDDSDTIQELKIEPRFTDQGHTGCIKSVAAGERYLASGSTDETIRLFDLKKHVELGVLLKQQGSITCIAFVGKTHMLSGSEDGTICVWECKTWECQKTLKGHRGAILSMSVHPSGRLALSVSKDQTIRTWNLLTGRAAYTTKLKEVGDIVSWSPSGNSYVIASGSIVNAYRISSSTDVCTISCQKTVLALTFINKTVLAVGGEAEQILLFNIEQEETVQMFKAHDIRVKGLCCVEDYWNSDRILLCSTASDGSLKCWGFQKEKLDLAPVLLTEIHMPGRPVCMTIKPPPTEQPQKSSKKVKSSKKEAMKQEDGHAEHSPGELEDDLENMLDVEVNKEEQNGTRKPREKTLSGSSQADEPQKKKLKKKKKKRALTASATEEG